MILLPWWEKDLRYAYVFKEEGSNDARSQHGKTPMPLQLPLSLTWPDQTTFENFYSENNAPVLTYLQQMVQGKGEKYIYLHGPTGAGLSHLLYAACHAMQDRGEAAAYLPFKKENLLPEVLDGMENLSLLCCDDVERIAGNKAWEEALFHYYNRAQISGTCLLIASHIPPTQIAWGLPDLGSRLASGVVFSVQALSDSQKIQALQYRAQKRGFDLPDDTANYLLNHCSRDMHALFAILEKLDRFSLAMQRRITIFFVKQVLGL